MIKIVSLKCPECRADLSVENNRKECFCQYCGTKILIDDGSTTHTYRKIDEARIKEADIQLRQLEIQEKERTLKREWEKEARESRKKLRIALVVIGLFMILGGIFVGELFSSYKWSDWAFLAAFWGLVIVIISASMNKLSK